MVRRRWSLLQKQAIVGECLVSGASVSVVARQHGVAISQLYAWRQQYGAASVPHMAIKGDARQGFAAVMVLPEAAAEPVTPPVTRDSRLEIVLCNGSQLIASGGVASAILVAVIRAMLPGGSGS